VDLARRLMAGDVSAFDSFVDVFRARVAHYTYLMCGQREDAEEVAQETLLKVFQSFDQLRDPANVRAWVFRIAKNICHMRRRRSVFAPERELSLDELRPSWSQDGDSRKLDIADWSELPDRAAISSEWSRMLHSAIRELPDAYRSVVLLRDIEEMSTRETAEVLELSEDVVKTRLHRARLAIRQILDRHLQAGAKRATEGVV